MSVTAQSLDGITEDPLIGVRIEGRYRVQRVHSRGGTSVIYSALYEERQREVAIKVLDASSAADPEAVQRFEVEARMGVALAHDNVVSVSDFGRLADGRPFLVMPMITGIDMATLLAHQGPQHPKRVAGLLKGVASALDLVHRRGAMHRDIKSENLMHVAHPDGSETAIVLDFGLASVRTAPALRGGAEVRASNLSPDVDSSGTPEFMAPEALAGEPLDHRGDIYSLATVAFELITGSLPFESTDLEDLKRKKASEAPRTLGQAAGAEFPASMESVIGRALARDPEQRQASASAFVRELEAAAADMTVWPLPNTVRKLPSRYPTLVGTGARAQKRTQMSVAKRPEPVVSRTKTLNALADRAQRFSSSNPPPADAGARFSSSNPPPAATERAQRFTSSTPAPPPIGGSDPALPAPPLVPRFDVVARYDHADSPDTHVRLRPSPTPPAPVEAAPVSASPSPLPAVAPLIGRTTRVGRNKGKSKSSPGTISSTPPAASDAAEALRSPLPEPPVEPAAVEPAAEPASLGPASDAPAESTADVATPPVIEEAIIVDRAALSAPVAPSKPPSVDEALARLAALEAEDVAAFRAPRSKRGLMILVALVATAVIAVVVWRHRPAQPSAAASAAVTPSPAPAAPAQPEAPVAAATAAPAVAEAPAAQAPATSTAEAKTAEPSTPEPATAAKPDAESPAKSSSHEAAPHSSKKSSSSSEKHHAAAHAEAAPAAAEPKPVASSGKTGDAVRGDPARAKLLGDQAADLMIRGDFTAAARAYQQAIGADQSYAPAWRGRGLALERLGKTHDAIAAFRQFLKLEPNGANAEKIRGRLKALDASP